MSKADGMMKICEIFVIFFDRMANHFDDILTGVKLRFPCRHFSGHKPANG
jgi:hypothetical protein